MPALPVFLACINRGEFCKALSTSSEVKCGRGATKQNKKQHQNEKKNENYLLKPYFPIEDCLNVNLPTVSFSLQFAGRYVCYSLNNSIHLFKIMNAEYFWLIIDSVRVEKTAPHWCCNACCFFSFKTMFILTSLN